MTNEDDDYHWAFDIDCVQKLAPVCQDIQVYFRMKGLCPDSVLDRLYRLVQPSQNGRRMFFGPSGWRLGWEDEDKFWRISNDRFPGLSANVTVTKYPVGTNTWRVSGGDGCRPEPYEVQLTLSACNDSQFTCDDGLCVHMDSRYLDTIWTKYKCIFVKM